MKFDTSKTIAIFEQELPKTIEEKHRDVLLNYQENLEYLIKKGLYTPIMLKADNKTISDYCLLNKLSPTSQLAYWLSFGFPENVKEIDVKNLTISNLKVTKDKSFSIKQRLLDYKDQKFIKGKYKGEIFSEVLKKDSNYINWVESNIPEYKTTMLEVRKK